MSDVVVSVAMATFDGESFVEAQLRSILQQERMPDEIVVSDGGSRDGTVEIVHRVLAEHPQVESRVLADGERLGVTANFARAIAATRGDLVALSDQDDLWHPDRIARGVAAFDDERVLLAHSDARLVDLDGSPLGLDLFAALGIGPAELEQLAGPHAFELLLRRNLVTGMTVMIRRELAELAAPFPDAWVHDEWLAVIAAANGRIAPDPVPAMDYRQHGANAIGVRAPTLRYRIGRMLEPRDDRLVRLAERSALLRDRLDPAALTPWRGLAAAKADFEDRRAVYPAARWRRPRAVAAAARGGSYARFSSQGRLDILRDLMQPAGRTPAVASERYERMD